MAIILIDPEGLPKVETHRQVAVATGSKLVFLAGQVAWDADGRVLGEGDLAVQVEQCYRNIATGLAAVGGSFHDVARLTIYVPNWTPDKWPAVEDGLARASAVLGFTPLAPITMPGIGAGFTPDILVEVEATAVLD